MFAFILDDVQVEGADTNVNRDVACRRQDTSVVDSASQDVTTRSRIDPQRRPSLQSVVVVAPSTLYQTFRILGPGQAVDEGLFPV